MIYPTIVLLILFLTIWGLHRLALKLEAAGYLYYRTERKGGVTGLPGAFGELDRFVRPSVEHTRQVEESTKITSDDVGGE